MRRGRPKDAIGDFSHYIQTLEKRSAPKHALAYNHRGVSRGMLATAERSRERPEAAAQLETQALKDFNEAIRLRADIPEFYNNRGFLRFFTRDLKGAVADYHEGLRLCEKAGLLDDKKSNSVWSFRQKLASVYIALGDKAAAERELALAEKISAERAKKEPR